MTEAARCTRLSNAFRSKRRRHCFAHRSDFCGHFGAAWHKEVALFGVPSTAGKDQTKQTGTRLRVSMPYRVRSAVGPPPGGSQRVSPWNSSTARWPELRRRSSCAQRMAWRMLVGATGIMRARIRPQSDWCRGHDAGIDHQQLVGSPRIPGHAGPTLYREPQKSVPSCDFSRPAGQESPMNQRSTFPRPPPASALALCTVLIALENEETRARKKPPLVSARRQVNLHAVQGERNRAPAIEEKPRGLMCSPATLTRRKAMHSH